MSTTSKWTRRLVQIAPVRLKQLISSCLPGRFKQMFSDHAFNQIDRAALQRFWQAHQLSAPTIRTLEKGLAVVIPCYNHARYLDATITCLLNQTYRPFHAVFVEDHSTDETWRYLQQLITKFPNDIQVTLLRTDRNRGQAAAINLGVQKTDASVYTVLNDDDYLMHDALEVIMRILKREPSLFLLGSSARILNGYSVPQGEEQPIRIGSTAIHLTKTVPQDVLAFTHLDQFNMTHSSMTFLRSAWQQVGGYYPAKDHRVVVFTDRDFQLRIAALYPTAISAQVPFVYWRVGSSVDSGLYS